jgi:small subunit ribosomal protein S21
MASQTTIKVVIDDSYGADRSLKRFKRLCESYGIVREYRKRQEYRKPSVRKLEKTAAAVKRRHKLAVKARRSSRI